MNDLIFFDKSSKTKSTILLADKAYESKKLRDSLKSNNYSLMIPKKSNAAKSYPFDKKLYKNRIYVEHTFQKLKVFRRIATRYDSLLDTYLAFLYFAISIVILKNM